MTSAQKEEGWVSRITPNLRTKRGEGVKKSQNHVDIIHGSSFVRCGRRQAAN